ncbi:hypothetical protein B0H13DRAFT_2122991 [Mycena leptocephala]|nr:hypothetical protein B0H13DRAFT_2122991 [Mycena leptocephala]
MHTPYPHLLDSPRCAPATVPWYYCAVFTDVKLNCLPPSALCPPRHCTEAPACAAPCRCEHHCVSRCSLFLIRRHALPAPAPPRLIIQPAAYPSPVLPAAQMSTRMHAPTRCKRKGRRWAAGFASAPWFSPVPRRCCAMQTPPRPPLRTPCGWPPPEWCKANANAPPRRWFRTCPPRWFTPVPRRRCAMQTPPRLPLRTPCGQLPPEQCKANANALPRRWFRTCPLHWFTTVPLRQPSWLPLRDVNASAPAIMHAMRTLGTE